MEDRCVMCGRIIPEGRQICPICEKGEQKMANKRLIDANAFLEHWNKEYRHQHANDMFKIAIANFPAVDAVEVVHGEWDEGVCTNCSFDIRCLTDGESDLEQWVWKEGFNYCPNCGADMRGETE